MDNKLIRNIIISQKDFVLLPRDKDGICYYDGDLIISNNKIKKLPDGLIVNGRLDCSYNQLTYIPTDLVVMGNLWCNNNQLTTLPADLYCSHNELKRLPDDLNIGGVLYCGYNRISKEITSKIMGNIIMDGEQKKKYDRVVKINKLKENIHG